MPRASSIMLSVLAVVLVGALAPGSAGAEEIVGCKIPASQPKCLVAVEGKKLGEKEKEEVTAKIKEPLVFTGVLSGTSYEIKASTFKLEKGSVIKGGNPAQGEVRAEFGEVKVEKPTGCEVEGKKIKSNLLDWWWVWLYKPFYASYDTVWLAFKGEPALFSFELKGEKCALNKTVVKVTGNVLSKQQTEKEAVVQTLTFAKIPENGVLYEFGGTVPISPKLEFNKEVATVVGSIDLELTSKKKWWAD